MNLQSVLKIVIVLYSVSNLLSLGIELNLKETIRSLKSFRLIILTILWGWVIGPAFAYLLTKVLPLNTSIAMGLIITSLAPVAPFFPILVRKAHADVDFSAALMPLAMVASVLFMPLIVPFMLKGLLVNSWTLAKPLLTLVFLPMIVGIIIRLYASILADRLFPVIKRIAGISTILSLLCVVIIYFPEVVQVLGSFAIGGQLIFAVGIMLMSFYLSIGLTKSQRSAMAVGMGSRNASAMFVIYFAFPNPDPYLLVMIVLAGPIPAISAYFVASFLGSKGNKT